MSSSAIRGDSISLTIGGDVIAESRDFSIAFDVSEYDVTSRDSGRWTESLSGRGSWTISGNALYIDADLAKKYMLAQIIDTTPTNVECIMTIGSQTFTGDAMVTSLSVSAPYAGGAEYSFTLKGTGTLDLSAS